MFTNILGGRMKYRKKRKRIDLLIRKKKGLESSWKILDFHFPYNRIMSEKFFNLSFKKNIIHFLGCI